jgi:GTP-binding protein
VLVALESGQTKTYALEKLQERGSFFVDPNENVYGGQIVGQHIRNEDLSVNLTKAKHLNNMRAAGKDKSTSLAPKRVFSLEEALEYIQADELVEATPKSLRMRKIELDDEKRKRTAKQQAAAAQ